MTTRASITTLGLVLGSALAWGGSALAADAPPTTSEVLTKLHESDQKEIQAGKMAEKNGQSQQVKDYGKMLVKDHTAADKKVTALAKEEKINLPKAPAAKESGMAGMTGGPNFDSKFAQEMVQDHQKDVAEVTQARDATTDPKLKKLLSDLVPTLQKHEDEAQKIVDSSSSKAK